MHRIDHETATSDHKFTEGNPTIPVPATVVTDDWLNAVQEELVAVITGAGLELEKSDNTQLWQAITTAVDNALPGLATTKNPGLVQIGDGLAITPQGLLSVLIASTSQAGLVKPRYGLKIGEDGSLDVDFGDMPTDKFEELLKSIRVPIWLTKNKSFYVNGTTGSDVLDGGRGESAEKPFKTLQAALNYVSDNYNMSKFSASINIAAGYDNDSLVTLPLYNATTGGIEIVGNSEDYNDIKLGRISLPFSVRYDLWNIKTRVHNITSGVIGAFEASSGIINLYNCCCDMTDVHDSTGTVEALYASTGGFIRIWATKSDNPIYKRKSGLYIDITGSSLKNIVQAINNGQIQYTADITFIGQGSCNTNLSVSNLSYVSRTISSFDVPGRLPNIVLQDGASVTGKRYNVTANSIVTVSNAGPEHWPGTIEGTVSSGAQYI